MMCAGAHTLLSHTTTVQENLFVFPMFSLMKHLELNVFKFVNGIRFMRFSGHSVTPCRCSIYSARKTRKSGPSSDWLSYAWHERAWIAGESPKWIRAASHQWVFIFFPPSFWNESPFLFKNFFCIQLSFYIVQVSMLIRSNIYLFFSIYLISVIYNDFLVSKSFKLEL